MKTESKKMMIWSDTSIDLDEWKDFLEEEYPEVTDEDEQYRLAMDMNYEYLEDERANLKKDVGGRIVIIADLGLWYGRRSAYKVLDSHDLSSVLYADGCDYHEWFVEDGELRGIGVHHDGTNRYIFRAMKPNLPYDLYYEVVNGNADEDQINEATRSLALDVATIYGWTA